MKSARLSVGDQIVDSAGRAMLGLVQKWAALLPPIECTVAGLPTNAALGAKAYVTDLRVFDGAGTREGAGAGSGGEVQWNGSAWVITGTNVTAAA